MLGAALTGAVVGVVVAFLAPSGAAVLGGWSVGALMWIAWTWASVYRFDAVATSQHATREDPKRAVADILLLAASIVSLVAVAMVSLEAARSHGAERAALAVLSMLSVLASWAVVHTIYALRYAALYYMGPDGGIDFNQVEKPAYSDFAYLAFTIGMTYQVSDTELSGTLLRRTALRHALLAYLFGTIIVAAAINLIAGLIR